MSDLDHDRPKTQAAASGGPPKPPKKTAKGLGDDSPDDREKLTVAEQVEIRQFLKNLEKKQG